MSKKQLFKKEKINTDLYVNVETGETLTSEHPDITSINKVNSEYIKYKSESFYIIDDNAIRCLEEILPKSDMVHVHTMIKMVYGSYNLLHDRYIQLHTKETLKEDLDLARVAFNRLLKKLYDKGIIWYMLGVDKSNKKVKHIMLNPNIARRTNTIHRKCDETFKTFKRVTIKPSKEFGD